MDNPIKQQLKASFPIFSQTDLVREILEKGQVLELPAGHQILDTDDFVNIIPLVIEGSIKVLREDDLGHEILLYYIQPGESCAMTLSSCLKRERSSVKAIAQTPTTAIAVPVDIIYHFLRKYPSWNDFIVDTYSRRFNEILEVVDTIAFQKMDMRLLKYLFDKGRVLGSSHFRISKTDIAKDLNSSREVISRLLRQMEKNGLIRQDGSDLELLDN